MRSWTRWLVPVAAAAVIGSGAAVTAAAADSAPQVPERTVEQVLSLAAGSRVQTLSGTVQTRAALGLPDLSGLSRLDGGAGGGSDGTAATDLTGLATRFLSGSNTLRVWADGPQRQRVQLLDPFQEINLVRDGRTVWTYSSKDDVAARAILPAGSDAGSAPTQQLPTPEAIASRALQAVDPSTQVTLGAPAEVAGRASYRLELTPRTTATLVERVVINVDAQNGAPLQAAVFARGQAEPALLTGFTAVDFTRPDASIFTFTPPSSARVEQFTLPGGTAKGAPGAPGAGWAGDGPANQGDGPANQAPTVTGEGWASIIALPVGMTESGAAPSAPGPAAEQLLGQLTRPVAGGRAFSSALLSVLITDDGRVLAGAVPVQALVEAAR